MIVIFSIRPMAKEIVHFFHSYTITIDGLGDVCTFAQMDLNRHGDPRWNSSIRPAANEGCCYFL